LTATSGVATENSGVIQWNGTLSDALAVDISYQVIVDTHELQVISNIAIIDTATNGPIKRTANLYVNLLQVYLPVLKR
jgi:hypothetical protein